MNQLIVCALHYSGLARRNRLSEATGEDLNVLFTNEEEQLSNEFDNTANSRFHA